jgi:hypothetical protein
LPRSALRLAFSGEFFLAKIGRKMPAAHFLPFSLFLASFARRLFRPVVAMRLWVHAWARSSRALARRLALG